ncbi:MAG: Coenzyme F420 hydrogenase/dehydrogenase, beta subunit C-terminal domain [Candidatus Aminicenantes bacterium]|nr:Coenzyme F420 hydrogenase/dehydrogenase, beta subunit C-terminal domain [Candidatus Aminicenantes bacterium]
MGEARVIDKGAEEATRELLRSLLESGKVSAVLALGRTGSASGGVAYSLFTDPAAFEADGAASPLLPFMPANAGGLLSRLTLQGPPGEPVAAVVKPCELRALIELVKLNQCSLDNILLISSTCSGVYPLDLGVDGALEEKLPGYWEAVKHGEVDEDVRPTCRACVNFVPENADIIVALLGEADLDTRCTLHVRTEKGAAFVSGPEGSTTSGELESEPVQRALGRREAFQEELFAGVEVGMQGLIRTFGRCIGCHACKTVCPICYCRLCYFDSQDAERSPEFYAGELQRKGGLRVPPDTVFFQLGRLAHMSVSCVGCGMCTDVCPADIPVSTIFSKVAASAQALFDYQPGRDVTEEIPLQTFEEEELAQVAA